MNICLVLATTLLISSKSNANEIYVTQSGNNLDLSISQQGRGHVATTDIDGDYTTVNIIQQNNSATNFGGHYSNVVVVGGNNNSVSTLQTGDGDHSSGVYVRSSSSGNTVDVYQDGADQRLAVSIYSDNNNIDINQTGTTSNQAYVLFSHNNAGPVNFTLNQSGGDTYGNIDTGQYATISCGSPGGCTVNVNQ